MKTSSIFKSGIASLVMMFFITQTSVAQTFSVDKSNSSVLVEGTSNVHDWEINAEEFSGTMEVTLNDGQLTKLSDLKFTVVAESLKSGKGGMDKNTYKALNTGKNKTITYTLNKVDNLDCTSVSQCKITTSGYLTIAGAKKLVEIVFDAKVSANKIVLTGSKDLKMTEFNVDPPKAMFGAITTGDEVTIKFNAAFNK